jgi:4-hydroxythreonine-4-phosphate dehydrogenase
VPTTERGSSQGGGIVTNSADKPLIITVGEPAGIGPDICLQLAADEAATNIVACGDLRVLQNRADKMGLDVRLRPYSPEQPAFTNTGELVVLDQPVANPWVCGNPDPANASALLESIDRAVTGCLQGEFSGLVTGPLQKSTINDAGIPFSGHTEYLAALTNSPVPVMMLASRNLRVALASTHLPLREVPDYLDRQRLEAVIRVLDRDLKSRFGIAKPVIIVCGLNPHAGESGHLGHEEQQIMIPLLNELRAEGMQLTGPLPADTAFIGASENADAVLAMYHDQGLPVLKYAGFGMAVNVTLGLPIIRTSVDHGTALDKAGTGKANPGSLLAAINQARAMRAG